MKTLKLIAKAGGRNYFFGEVYSKGQKLVKEFTSAKELCNFLSERSTEGNQEENHTYVDLYRVGIIKAEYRKSRTYYSRFEFHDLKFCEKIFNQLAR